MILYINREPRELPELRSLQEVLHQVFPGSLQGIAVAVNDQVIPRDLWQAQTVQDQDSILIIQATRGG